MGKIPHVKKIVVLRANALGDFIFALPALSALKKTYPHTELVLLGKKWHKDFLDKRPSPIDRVIVVPPFRGVSENDTFRDEDPTAIAAFFKEVQKEHFDIAIQIHGGGRNSNPFLLKLGARMTIGTRTEDAPLLDRWLPYQYYQNETLRYLEVVKLIGATTSQITPELTPTKNDEHEADTFLPQEPYVILHPGATDVRRRWSPTHFAKVGDALSQKGYRIIVTGTGNERTIVEEVIQKMREPAIDGIDTLSLGGFAAALAKATIVISNDTGPLHLACAVGAKTVGIYWCGNLINSDPLKRMDHHPILSWTIHCPLCGMNIAQNFPFLRTPDSCQHDVSFVDSVTPKEVLTQVYSLLNFSTHSAQSNSNPLSLS